MLFTDHKMQFHSVPFLLYTCLLAHVLHCVTVVLMHGALEVQLTCIRTQTL